LFSRAVKNLEFANDATIECSLYCRAAQRNFGIATKSALFSGEVKIFGIANKSTVFYPAARRKMEFTNKSNSSYLYFVLPNWTGGGSEIEQNQD
jgi:hypothetical protein